MGKIDRLLTLANKKSQIYAENKKWEEVDKVLRRMTNEQLIEIIYRDVSEDRMRELFDSVGGLEVFESL